MSDFRPGNWGTRSSKTITALVRGGDRADGRRRRRGAATRARVHRGRAEGANKRRRKEDRENTMRKTKGKEEIAVKGTEEAGATVPRPVGRGTVSRKQPSISCQSWGRREAPAKCWGRSETIHFDARYVSVTVSRMRVWGRLKTNYAGSAIFHPDYLDVDRPGRWS